MQKKACLSVLAALASLVLTPEPADAQCHILPSCDALNSSCLQCDPVTTDIAAPDTADEGKAQTGRSMGHDLGAAAWSRHLRDFERTNTGGPPGPPVDATAQVRAEALDYWSGVGADLLDTARGGAADLDEVIDHLTGPRNAGGVRVPIDQGVKRHVDPRGNWEVKDPVWDPVDPVTGELVVEHDDLTFPGFGIPFHHRRLYRSRVAYAGPLGQGWDFTYNQRLVAAPPSEPSGSISGTDGLPFAAADSDSMTDNPTGSCGPLLYMTTGATTTIRFREHTRREGIIEYTDGPAELELRGYVDADSTTWELRAPGGDVRRFDEYGLLVSWRDSNGVGLELTWEAGSLVDWRLARVEDSVGRLIHYTYDGADRILSVTEPTSGMNAAYEYDADGGLRWARRADGRSETYVYDVQQGRDIGRWIPEAQLADACSTACAMSTRSCDAGGACDAPVAAATSACLAACPACATECSADCNRECQDGCSGACATASATFCNEPLQISGMVHDCHDAYEDVGEGVCDSCVEQCRNVTNEQCHAILNCLGSPGLIAECLRWTEVDGLPSELLEWTRAASLTALECLLSPLPWFECNLDWFEEAIDRVCVTELGDCCAFGDSCIANSCTAGRECGDDCRGAFIGYAVGNGCPATPPAFDDPNTGCWALARMLPRPGTPEYEALIECSGTGDEWALAHGCYPTWQRDCIAAARSVCMGSCRQDCGASCGAACNEACHVDHCASYCITLDLPGECERTCTSACIEEAHLGGVKYGYTADLQFNLVKVFDGNGDVYLENTYGRDIESPNFDAVIAQQFGAHKGELQLVDLAAGDHTTDWAVGLVAEPETYAAPAICHYGCEAAPPDPRDVAVPWDDVVLVFGAGASGEFPAGGWSAGSSLDDAARQIQAAFISVDPTHGARIARRAVTSALDGIESTLQLQLPAGKVYLQIASSGEITMEGDGAAIAEVTAAGGLTVFGDGTMLRAYPGAPRAVIAVAEGRCTEPFHLVRSAADRVTLEPADACSDSLWLAPVAGPAAGLDAAVFQAEGQGAISRSYFTPSTLVPSRGPVVLSRQSGGEYALAAAPSPTAVALALELSKKLYETQPLFSAPDPAPPMVPASDEVVYVYHQDTESKPGGSYPPSLPPTDEPWSVDDTPDTVYQPPCDPTVPGPVLWGDGESGPGAKPMHATALLDLHGARWTFYADANNKVIRTVNHDTGSSRWFEHDPDGRLTGVLAPDGARQCLRYDDRGNLAEVLRLPAPVAGLATPAPIRQRFGWTDTHGQLQSIVDPRDPSRLLQSREYDANGNLRAIVAIDGARTEFTLVGGSGPARAMPQRVVGPDGAVTQITYDVSNGTVRTITQDATSSSPVSSEVQADAAGRPLWTLSPLGLIETFEWDGPLLVERSWDADGLVRTESYSHDDDTQVTRITRNRQQVDLSHDAIGEVYATTQTALDASLPAANRCRRIGAEGRLYEQVSAEGDRVRFTHDGEGRVTSVVAGDLGPSQGSWDDSCPAQSTGQSVDGPVVSYQYDTSGRATSVTDGRGMVTTWSYDGFGRPIIERRPDGGKTHTGYDAVGQVSWQALYSSNGGQSYAKPSPGQPGLLAMTEVVYDLRGRIQRVDRWHFDAQGAAIGDGLSQTYYAYNEITRTVAVTDDVGRVTRSRADGAGRGVEVVLPDGSAIHTAYLDGGRTVRTSRTAVGGTVVDYTTLTATGQVAESSIVAGGITRSLGTQSWIDPFLPGAATSADGVTSTPTYDAFERLTATRVDLPGGVGEQVELLFDREGRTRSRSSVAAPGQLASKWSFSYDALGRLIRETDPAGAATVIEYIGATGFARATTDARLVRTTMTYADSGWLQTAFADAPAAGTDITLSFQHDHAGRMLMATRQDGTQVPVRNDFAWDSLGNMISETDDVLGVSARRTHVFDGAGQRRSTTLAGHTATRSYDTLGRQTTLIIDGASPAAATWTYDAMGGPKVRRLANGVETRYGYDKLSRLTSVSDWRNSAALAIHEWQVPLDGVPRQLSSQRAELPTTASLFAIDGLGRLTAEQSGVPGNLSLDALSPSAVATTSALAGMTSARTSYALDGRHNWLTRTVASMVTSYQRDARDALTAVGATPITTDVLGAITHDGTTAYTYDALGQLAGVQPANGAGRLYRRDALGRIVSETDAATGIITRHAYDGAQRIATADATGALAIHFAAEGLDAPVMTLFAGGGRTYYHQDRQGSVYALTDTAGNPTRWISYSAYGEPTLHDGAGRLLPPSASLNTFGYHGLPHDFALGLVDMRARAYAPTLGRFLSPDPIGLAGGSNLFAFVDSSPLAGRDPFGLARRAAEAFAAWPKAVEAHAYVLFGIPQDQLRPGPSLLGSAVDAYGEILEGRLEVYKELQDDMSELVIDRAKCLARGPRCTYDEITSIPGKVQGTIETIGQLPDVAEAIASDPKGAFCGESCSLHDLGRLQAHVEITAISIYTGRVPAGNLAQMLSRYSRGFRRARVRSSTPDVAPAPAPAPAPRHPDALPDGVEPYQLELFPRERYDRVGHYGRTPTPAQRASVPPGMEFDHDPMLVQHYWEGPGPGRLAGHNLTPDERRAFAADVSHGTPATPAAQRAQGAAAALYSRTKNRLFGL